MNKTFADFSGFTEDPFKRMPDINFYFFSKHHEEALNTLHHLLHSDEGFALMEGESGTGKSVTIQRFIQDLPPNMVFAYILLPNLRLEELLQAVLEDFGISLEPNMSKNALFSHFKDFLISMKEEEKTVMIIVDEAQNLSTEILDGFRILSDLETGKEKSLKIVLAAQPELENKLNSNELKTLKQRITLSVHLKNFTADECLAYIHYKMKKAGRTNLRISSSVGKQVWRSTKGNPRLVNMLMERSITAAYIENTHTLKTSHLKKALSSMNNIAGMKLTKPFRTKTAIAAAVIALLALASLGYYRQQFKINPTTLAAIDKAPAQNNPARTAPASKPTDTRIPAQSASPAPVVKTATPTAGATGTENEGSIQGENNPPAQPVPASPPTDTHTPVQSAALAPAAETAIPTTASATGTENEMGAERDPASATIFPSPVEAAIPETPAENPATTFGIGDTAIVNVPSLNVRALPLLDAERIGALYEGQRVVIKEESSLWVRIAMPGHRDGWAYKEYLRPLEDD